MSARNDGGPAFPEAMTSDGSFGGMSLRDWFAGQALAGMTAGAHGSTESMAGLMSAAEEFGEAVNTVVAVGAFKYADAMLAAREGRS